MAKDTDLALRKQMIYQVFPRQYSKTGDFEGVRLDLDRIKALGTDILYLLPIHPIGKKNRKGSVGCPYSIYNYREINPDYGTLADFKRLVADTHAHGMKIMIDVVYNHTSRDSYLLQTHPEWFYKDKNGEFNNRIGEWWDVTDFDYSKDHGLYDELIDTLCYWLTQGVDGFRFDVASLVPADFWKEARAKMQTVNPNVIMLAETVHPGMIKWVRMLGFDALTDYEAYESFDIEYDYDIVDEYRNYIKGKGSLTAWLDAIIKQEGRYPKNFIKSHCLDNHDWERCAKYVTDPNRFRNMVAMNFFFKGTTFVYAGLEALDPKTPSLFEKDPVDWTNLNQYDICGIIHRMSTLKKDDIFVSGIYDIHFHEGLSIAHIDYVSKDKKMIGIFNPDQIDGVVEIEELDGIYENLFNHEKITIEKGKVSLGEDPIILCIEK